MNFEVYFENKLQSSLQLSIKIINNVKYFVFVLRFKMMK